MFKEVKAYQQQFGKQLANDLKQSLETALKKAGGKNVQEAKLSFDEQLTTSNEGISLKIIASDDYWYWVNKGRKPGKMPPPDKLGKKWQASQGIDARKVIADIELKYKQKHPAKKSKGLNKPSKKLNYNDAAKQLSFIIARSIGKKGYKPRPFIDSVLNDGRLEVFKKTIGDIVGKQLIFEFNINGSNNT